MKNEYIECLDNKIKIILPSDVHGTQYAIIDKEDLDRVKAFNWTLYKNGNTIYVLSSWRQLQVSLHRLICSFPVGMVVDHIDMNGLNNSKSNLRICTHLQNMANRRPQKGSKLGIKGVIFRRNRFIASVCVNSKKIIVGNYMTKEEAVLAYNEKVLELKGSFANLTKME